MYDGKSQLLIKNPINRYLINSPMLPDMKTNPDGSLTLYNTGQMPQTLLRCPTQVVNDKGHYHSIFPWRLRMMVLPSSRLTDIA
jgi:hypothetical protein